MHKHNSDSSCSYLNLSPDPIWLDELSEAIDILDDVDELQDGSIIARFRFGPVRLPADILPQLRPLVGLKVGVLRLSGYHVRCISKVIGNARQ